MLDALVAASIDGATEREFDALLLAVLRKAGFSHISFIHGAFEFGQDVSARLHAGGVTWQYGIQSKAGDVGVSDWRNNLKPQLQTLVEKKYLHGPAFDPTLPRRVVSVITGRLKGAATVEAEEYRRHVLDHYGVEVEYWDRERLIELLVGSPEALLPRADPQLIALIGRLLSGDADTIAIERRSRSWMGNEGALVAGAAEAAVLAHYSVSTGRFDLSCHIACCLMRAGLWAEFVGLSVAAEFRDAGQRLLVASASRLLDSPIGDALLLPISDGPAVFVTYPARVLRLVEYLSLLALLEHGDIGQRAQETVTRLIEAEPGAAYPLSDRWGPSIANAAAAIGASNPDLVADWLRQVAAWVADHRETGLGLAPYNATPREEVDHLLGAALEHVDVPKRRDSSLAALLLDISLALGNATLLDDLINEWRAVALDAPALAFEDAPDALLLTGQGMLHPNVLDSDLDESSRWRPVHHPPTPRLVESGRAADLMVVATVTRDRHFPAALKALIESRRATRE